MTSGYDIAGDVVADGPPSFVAKWRKALAVFAVSVATFVASVLTDGISTQEWVMVAGVALSAAGTAVVPNLDSGVAQAAKSVVTFLLAGLSVLAVTIMGGLTVEELLTVMVAAFAAVGVTALPNDWPPATLRASVDRSPRGYPPVG